MRVLVELELDASEVDLTYLVHTLQCLVDMATDDQQLCRTIVHAVEVPSMQVRSVAGRQRLRSEDGDTVIMDVEPKFE